MKKLTMILSLVVLFAFTASAYAQTKGETQFGLGGSLYENFKGKASGSKSNSMINPSVSVRYLVMDKIGVDGGLTFTKFGGSGAPSGSALDLDLGGRYYYYAKDKMRVNGGLDLEFNLGKLNETFDDKGKKANPYSLMITPAELEYWPMEGGAVYGDVHYNMYGLNLGDNGVNGFGIGLGIKIRLK